MITRVLVVAWVAALSHTSSAEIRFDAQTIADATQTLRQALDVQMRSREAKSMIQDVEVNMRRLQKVRAKELSLAASSWQGGKAGASTVYVGAFAAMSRLTGSPSLSALAAKATLPLQALAFPIGAVIGGVKSFDQRTKNQLRAHGRAMLPELVARISHLYMQLTANLGATYRLDFEGACELLDQVFLHHLQKQCFGVVISPAATKRILEGSSEEMSRTRAEVVATILTIMPMRGKAQIWEDLRRASTDTKIPVYWLGLSCLLFLDAPTA